MNKVVIHQVWVEDKLKFTSIDEQEAKDYCQLVFDSTGILAEQDVYERSPVDHTKGK